MQSRIVWCLSDGRPGHYNQSRGILKALEKMYRIEEHWIEVRLRVPFLRRLLAWALNARVPGAGRLVLGCYRVVLPRGRPDIIVSAGGNTQFLNAALAHSYQARNLFAGSLRHMHADQFTACITLEAGIARNAIQVPLAPTGMDRDEMEELRATVRSRHGWQGVIWCLAIGGDSGNYRFSAAEWESLAQFMMQVARRQGVQWLLTTSRRTGADTEQLLQGLLAKDCLLDAVWYVREPRKVMREYLAAADLVFCTEDSLTMLTEAISAGRAVISLRPAQVVPDAAYQAAIARLAQQKWLVSTGFGALGGDALVTACSQLEPLQESIPAQLAARLADYL